MDALDAVIVNLSGIDNLKALFVCPKVVTAYPLNGVENAEAKEVWPRPEKNVETIPKIVSIAAAVQELQ